MPSPRPKRNASRRVALASVFSLLLAASAVADEAPPACSGRDLTRGLDAAAARAARADELTDAQGLLWRVSRDGLAPSYLFGTIHSTDDEAVAIARRASELAAKAQVVATELGAPMDLAEKSALGAKLFASAIDREDDTFAAGARRAPKVKWSKPILPAAASPRNFRIICVLWFLALQRRRGRLGMRRPAPGRGCPRSTTSSPALGSTRRFRSSDLRASTSR